MRPDVVDDTAHHRFTSTIDGHVAELTYERSDDRIVLVHTGRAQGSTATASAGRWCSRRSTPPPHTI